MGAFGEGYALGWRDGVLDAGDMLRRRGEWKALRALAVALDEESDSDSETVKRRAAKMALGAMQEWEESDGEKNSVGDA